MTDFRGQAKRLVPKDYRDAADLLGVKEAHIRTIFEVECRGNGFDVTGRPEILFERHRFYVELGKGKKRDEAVRKGLAYPKWGTKPYLRTAEAEWKEFFAACAIDEDAAIRSASWGLPQILGDNFKDAGYSSPKEMAEAFAHSEREQLFAFCRLIQAWNLVPVMLDFPNITATRKFARKYNGPQYAKNKYHTKLADAFERWNEREQSQQPMDDEDGILRVGSYNSRVGALQRALKDRNYYQGKIDDKFGRGTRNAVMAWKADNNIIPSPTMSQEEMDLLDRSPVKPTSVARATMTHAELQQESEVASNAGMADNVLKYGAGAAAVAKGADSVGLLDRAEEVSDQVGRATGVWETITDATASFGINVVAFIADHAVWVVAGVVVVGVIYIHRAQVARLEAARKSADL